MNKLVKLSATAGVVGFMLFSHNVLAAEVEKQDNQIVVNEPTVEYSTESAETYVNKDLVYKTEIPDDIEINSGDQLRYTLPEELNWTTRQEFNVTNPDGEVVGNAVASNETRDVVTTFNDYFQSHPIDKSFEMRLSTMWRKEVVQEGQKYDLNFQGTVVKDVEVKPQGKANPQEIVAKWGWQDNKDENLIQWGGRVNFVKHHLVDVNVSDTWDDNNEYVPGSLRIFELSSAEPWVGIREIKPEEFGTQFYKNGFKFHIPEVNNIISVEYKTRMKNKPQNPVNVLSFTSMGQEYSFEREIKVANATGSAKGKVRPFTWDVPPAPVYDIPEYNGDAVPLDPPVYEKPGVNIEDIPMLPPAPTFELPEWQGGVVPNDPPILELPEINLTDVPLLPPAPVHELPEFDGGVVPLDPPVVDKPELDITDIPVTPPAPVHELPELEIPEVPTEEHDKQKVKVVEDKPEVKEYKKELPKTGEESTVNLIIVGLLLINIVIELLYAISIAVNLKKLLKQRLK